MLKLLIKFNIVHSEQLEERRIRMRMWDGLLDCYSGEREIERGHMGAKKMETNEGANAEFILD